MPETTQRNFRLRKSTEELLEQIAERLQVNQTTVVHLAILEMAVRLGSPGENQHPERIRKRAKKSEETP